MTKKTNNRKQRVSIKFKQEKIDVLKELKEMLDDKPDKWSYTIYIDEIIKDLENCTEVQDDN